MRIIPSIDLTAGRSRLVWWPGAGTATGAPTDRPERIARALVDLGAPMLHLVDLDGAGRGQPANLGAIRAVAGAVATPLQVSGGIDGPEQVEIAFAAGATRVVVPLWAVAEDPARLAACLRVAGDWLAVGVDARPDRIAAYPWRHRAAPTLPTIAGELAAAGVRRLVVSHLGTAPDPGLVAALAAGGAVEVLVAGGVTSAEALGPLRDAGVAGVIVGEAVFTGAIDLRTVLAVAVPATGGTPGKVTES